MRFLPTLCDYLRRGHTLALATVIQQQGSAPRGAGSRMLAHAEGLVAGTVGGGLVEAQTLNACTRALTAGRGCVLDFDLSGEMAAQAEMICGGRVQVLVEVLLPQELAFWETVLACLHKDGGVVLVPLDKGIPAARTLLADGTFHGAIPPSLPPEVYSMKDSVVLRTGGGLYCVQPLLPPLRLILVGGGHISRPTAHIAALAGYAVLVLDDRPEFAQPQRFPEAHTQVAEKCFVRCFDNIPFVPNARTGIVIVTRGHVHDATVLEQALTTKAGYIGMIGSTRKRDSLYSALVQQGCSREDLARVHCPVGLPIQAETPEEIAVSIVAECIQHFAAQG